MAAKFDPVTKQPAVTSAGRPTKLHSINNPLPLIESKGRRKCSASLPNQELDSRLRPPVLRALRVSNLASGLFPVLNLAARP